MSVLALVLYAIISVNVWNEENARYFYLIVLCFVETLISLLYVFFNRKTLTRQAAKPEFISIAVYMITAVIIYAVFLR